MYRIYINGFSRYPQFMASFRLLQQTKDPDAARGTECPEIYPLQTAFGADEVRLALATKRDFY